MDSKYNETLLHWGITALNLILCGYLVWRIQFKASLVHINLRIVLCCTYFIQYNLISLGRITDEINIWIVSNHIFSFNSQSGVNHELSKNETMLIESSSFAISISNFFCLISKLMHDVGLLSAANSDLLIVIERYIATRMPENYEGKSARIGITIVCSFYLSCCVLVGGIAFYDALMAGSFSIWTSHGSCQTAALHPYSLVAFWWWAVAASYIGTFALFYLYRYNKKQCQKSLGRAQLTIRYQYSENVRTLRAIIPAIMLNAVFFTISLYFIIVYLMKSNNLHLLGVGENVTDSMKTAVENPITTSFMFKFIYTFADVYGLIFAVIFILRMKSVLAILYQDIQKLRCCSIKHAIRSEFSENLSSDKHWKRNGRNIEDNIAHKAKVSDKHFQQLNDMWK